ncbi:LOW QUALITY PROTEIN: inactive serine protease 54 [Carlito syrichta]|uniref:Inactive serine protease 54 n=1 Tax=Carlito syrichta TaxID=1868482 RepID=A0A1U7U7X9_CARSF|nr:LOW QUALITY PROTEIN: inactive serine protease 54 [Carlito syrichta]
MVSTAGLSGDGRMRGVLLVLLCVLHSSSGCGIRKVDTLEDSEEDLVSSMEFPWLVSLQDFQYTHLAFGCILSEFWILSIASALQNRKDVVAIVGIDNMDPRGIAHTEYPINTIIIHEDFDNNSMNNNIALLKTDTAMHFSSLVQSICFLDKKLHVPPVLWNCWVSGWNPTAATGNHMTTGILRKISVKDIDLCPSHKLQKTGCGSHTQKKTKSVCLGDPGSPMMCQLRKLNMWVLRGILNYGGGMCPGLFLYTRVEDYSNWITSKAERAGLTLSSLHYWEKFLSFSHDGSYDATTQETHLGLDHVGRTQPYFQGQRRATRHSQLANTRHSQLARDGLEVRDKGVRELGRSSEPSIQPLYYDYYGGEVGEGGPFAGQNRVHQPQEIILVSFVLFFCNSV